MIDGCEGLVDGLLEEWVKEGGDGEEGVVGIVVGYV